MDKMEQAKKVYATLCTAINNRNWQYTEHKDSMVITFGVASNDINMNFILAVDAERQLIRLLSPMPFDVSEDKRIDLAVATCVATNKILDGSFDFDMSNGKIVFRLTASFIDSEIGEKLLQYMISFACAVVDGFNDKFAGINDGKLSLSDFLASEA